MIRIPDDMLSPSSGPDELIKEIFGTDPARMRDVDFMIPRAILTPRNVDVDIINSKALDVFPGQISPSQPSQCSC